VSLRKNDQSKLYIVIIVSVLNILQGIARTLLNANFVQKVTRLMKHVYTMFNALTAAVIILLLVLSVQHTESDMRLLQHNTQSIHTSLPLLKHAVQLQRLNIDVVFSARGLALS